MSEQAARLPVCETSASFVIPNVRYRGTEAAYEVRKRLLSRRTLEEHVQETLRAEQCGNYGVGDVPLHFALFRALYAWRNEQEQQNIVEKARRFFGKKLKDYSLSTLTSIAYHKNQKAVVTHRQGMQDAQRIEAAVAGDDGYFDVLPDLGTLCRVMYDASKDEVCDIMHWLTGWRAYARRPSKWCTEYSVAMLSTGSDEFILECYGGRFGACAALGVRLAPKNLIDALLEQETKRGAERGNVQAAVLSMNPAWLGSDIEVEESGRQIPEEEIARACDIALQSGHTTPEKVIEVVKRQLLAGEKHEI